MSIPDFSACSFLFLFLFFLSLSLSVHLKPMVGHLSPTRSLDSLRWLLSGFNIEGPASLAFIFLVKNLHLGVLWIAQRVAFLLCCTQTIKLLSFEI